MDHFEARDRLRLILTKVDCLVDDLLFGFIYAPEVTHMEEIAADAAALARDMADGVGS